MDKDSVVSTVIAVIGILVVMSFAIAKVEDSSIRAPFLAKTKVAEVMPGGDAPAGAVGPLSPALPPGGGSNAKAQVVSVKLPDKAVDVAVKTAHKNLFSFERLTLLGLKNFLISPSLFDGILSFGVNVTEMVNIPNSKFEVTDNSNKKTMLSVVEFYSLDPDALDEIYRLLRDKFSQISSVKINENNQFGLASFYINPDQAENNVFLVVKWKDAVYILYYLKDLQSLIKGVFTN